MHNELTTEGVHIRWTRPDEKNQVTYSHSIVEAILTCPVWGIIRYVKGLYYPITNRQLALEAGGAMHEVFAAVRCWQLLRIQNLPEHFEYNARRLFGDDRFASIWTEITDNPRDELINFCFQVLNSGEFYDDPSDTARTLAHMEETIIRYVDDRLPSMERNPIWVADADDPSCPVGIEQIFDVIITYQGKSLRYIGTIDGIVLIKDGQEFMVDENKTASRLDETWRRSFSVKSQPTGYIAVAKMLTGLVGDKVRIIGCKVKQQRSSEDMLSFIETKTNAQIMDWVNSLFFAHELAQRYTDDPLSAPKFTHSCSRYFRSCAFIDMCAAEPNDQRDIYDGLVAAELTPSQKAVQGD